MWFEEKNITTPCCYFRCYVAGGQYLTVDDSLKARLCFGPKTNWELGELFCCCEVLDYAPSKIFSAC